MHGNGWSWRWRWEPVPMPVAERVLVSVTKTWTRRKCNWTWSGWKAIKGGTSLSPVAPKFYHTHTLCVCFFMCLISVIVTFMASNSKRFSKRWLHLHVTHFQTIVCLGLQPSTLCLTPLFFFLAPGCISNYAKARSGNHHPLWATTWLRFLALLKLLSVCQRGPKPDNAENELNTQLQTDFYGLNH